MLSFSFSGIKYIYVLKYSTWILCPALFIFFISTIFAFRTVIPHYPKAFFFILYWLVGLIVLLIKLIVSSLDVFGPYLAEIDKVICSGELLLLPYIAYFLFEFFFYSGHTSTFIITFFPPSSVCQFHLCIQFSVSISLIERPHTFDNYVLILSSFYGATTILLLSHLSS